MIASSTWQAATARGDLLGEVHAQLDRVHIHEDLAVAESADQLVVQPSSQMTAFLTTVANEDATAPSSGHSQSRYRSTLEG